jgi:perosamine synthetase
MIGINELLLKESSTLKQALEAIDHNALGVVFAVDTHGKMTGMLTDGDIRRSLLKGSTLDTRVTEIMGRTFVWLPVSTPREKILEKLTGKISYIPLLDDEQKPVDFASVNRLHRIPVMEPSLGGNEFSYVLECLKTNWISSQGKFVTQFEETFRDYHGALYALAVSNGTVALHLALLSMGIGEGDEVIVPDLTFAASANAVIHAGASPVFVDIDEETWTLDPARVEEAITPKTKAIMPVHLYGHPCDMDALMKIAARHRLLIIEDAAEALGALYKKKLVGAIGDAGCFSFFGNKLITTGEGGMILFKKEEHFEKAKRLRDHGMDPQKRYWHTDVGYNYRLTNLQAAIGVAQMEQVDGVIEKKLALAQKYREALWDMPGLTLPPSKNWARNVYWLFTLLVDEAAGLKRDDLMRKLLQNGIETRPTFYPLHEMPPYQKYLRKHHYPVSERISRTGLSLPSAVTLSISEIEHISQAFKRIFGVRDLLTR